MGARMGSVAVAVPPHWSGEGDGAAGDGTGATRRWQLGASAALKAKGKVVRFPHWSEAGRWRETEATLAR